MILAGEERGRPARGARHRRRPRPPGPDASARIAAQKQADDAHRRFRDEASDFGGLLKLWHFFLEAQGRRTQNQLRKLCRESFLSYVRMREWSDVHLQLSPRCVARDRAFKRERGARRNDEAVHRALLPGLLSRVGHVERREPRLRRRAADALPDPPLVGPGARSRRRGWWPPSWWRPSQLFARTAAKIDPAWLEAAGGALCKRSYGDPHWAEKPARR